MIPEVDTLIAALERARELLLMHGDKWISGRLDDLVGRLSRRDWTAIQSALSEVTGGMGSLRDRQLSVSNGDAIAPEAEREVNAKLDSLVIEVERSARAAGAALGLPLVR